MSKLYNKLKSFVFPKQKTTGTEVITSFKKKFKKQKSASDVKFSGAFKKFRQAVSLDEVVTKMGQMEQKISGKPVTKSGWNKAKDLPPSQKGKKTIK